MPSNQYRRVFEIGAENEGYVTVEQARLATISPKTLHTMVRRGDLEHVSHGVYRLTALPPSPLAEYMEASLWPYGTRGVLSHETALLLHELSDVNPAKIHLTVPRQFRIRRQLPALYVVHHADIADTDVEQFEGIPVTAPVRTIRDCHAAKLGPALVGQAIEDGLRIGRLTTTQAKQLEEEIFGTTPRGES